MTARKATKKTISVTLDADVLDELQKLIEAGEASSLSSVINETLRSRIERRRQARQAREYIEEHLLGGERLSDPEVVEARGMVAAVQARAAARRSSGATAA
ncbi:ribbon-helix-helix protein, CopG family [Streptomyces harbinensis]|uniref:ribbon-helix-helix protein, CopG family n=1 Tax=Streptomyces harbinensis TaxID=1176198 RepID=UPI0034DEBE9E